MKLVNKEVKEIIYTLELTERELIILYASLGVTTDSSIARFCNDNHLPYPDIDLPLNLYQNLGKIIKGDK